MKPKIKYIDYGIGFTIGDKGKNLYIQLNKNLKKYPKLKKQVLTHEMLHWNAKSNLENFKIDFYDLFNFKKSKDLAIFSFNYPKSLLCNSPFFIEQGKIVPNWFMVGLWSVIFSFILIGGKLII